MNNKCGPCLTGNCADCANEWVDFQVCNCTHIEQPTPTAPVGKIGAALNLDSETYDTSTRTRRFKNDDSLKDIQSTGRKRAAALYPLKDKDGNPIPCDFANKAQCLPNFMEVQIDGCGIRKGTMAGKAQARHHHNYVVTDNERENVGLLCHSCHNLLHAKNDPFKDVIYERIFGYKPETSDLKWANKALKSGVVGGGQIAGKDETLG